MIPVPPSGKFEKNKSARWQETERLMVAIEKKEHGADLQAFPKRFRELCADLALARYRMHGQGLLNDLNARVIRGYKLLYRRRSAGWEVAVRGVMVTFPAAVRREWRLFWLSSALFWVPFFALLISVQWNTQWAESILGGAGMQGMEQMYGGNEADTVVHLRKQFGSNFMMFCHYIQNNVGIDFQLFAGGVLAGLGTMFYLFFNGLHIGAAAGYVQVACNPQSFWSFVVGHSSFELLGMIVVGMAGLRMGMGILRPGRLRRAMALRESTRQALPLLFGGAVMTALAAVVEGFWSASEVPHDWKYLVGGSFWLIHLVYFLFVGRGREVRA